MRTIYYLLPLLPVSVLLGSCADHSMTIVSPDNGQKVLVKADKKEFAPVSFDLLNGDETLLSETRLGLNTNERSFEQLRLVEVSEPVTVTEDYYMPTGKRMHCVNPSTNRTYTFVNENSDTLKVDFRLFPDGLAFRYVLPGANEGELAQDELTAYNIPDGTRRWFQSYDIGYERFFPLATDGSDVWKHQDHKWGYPGLLEPVDNKFVLITESDITRGHAASYLTNETDSTVYAVVYGGGNQPITPGWSTPWRVMISGELDDVVESTLVTDVATPGPTDKELGWIRPAPVSWIYWAYNHGSNDLNIIKKYIDLADEMGWPYMLIDAEWDEMKGGHNVEEAFEYAHQKHVKPMIWYNSCTGWIDGAPGPKWRLNKPEDRQKEFEWLRKNGVKGVKIDFFGGDDVTNMDYSIDLLEDALDNRLYVTLHGATVPRGWARTYPNLMTTEGVYGAEWYNNKDYLTTRAAKHNATLPFTRNVIGSMDYTPGTFSDSQHPHITSHGHELALTILFESAMQHMPDRPEAYLSLPSEVKKLLSTLPTVWEDTKLLSGYPGEYVVMARKADGKWYIAGINGTEEPMTLKAPLEKLGLNGGTITIYPDGEEERSFGKIETRPLAQNETILEVPTRERGGFVAVIEPSEEDQVNVFGNALVPDMIADASIVQFGDTFYCYATTDGYGQGLATSGPAVVWKSKDFVNWEMDGTYFPSAIDQKYWAPSKAIEANGKYYIYPTINGKMYPAVADSPEGPFRLAKGEDKFDLPYTDSTLLLEGDRDGIDAEVFIDDDGQRYLFFGKERVVRLEPDMYTLADSVVKIPIPRQVYTEGPIFFKRNGIYYYLYTIGGDEEYKYGYMMSKESPLGPWIIPEEDVITRTNRETGVYGPGHGCVFNVNGTDDWYFAFLEFGRNSTNRQTYVNRMEFNPDGTIKPIQVDINGVGALAKNTKAPAMKIEKLTASSVHKPTRIQYFKDPTCRRTEYFAPKFAADGANGSRWMASEEDAQPWLIADLGDTKNITKSELFFVRPTAGTKYLLEGSVDGTNWEKVGGDDTLRIKAPLVDEINKPYRYLRVSILEGQPGVWEWRIE